MIPTQKTIRQLSSISSTVAQQISSLAIQLGYPNHDGALLKRAEVILTKDSDCLFVAEIDDQVVGWTHAFIAWRIESPLFVEISGLVVDQHHRKLGIGKGLVTAVQNWSKLQGIDQLCVRCNVTRKESHLFYKNIGFSSNKQQAIFTMEI